MTASEHPLPTPDSPHGPGQAEDARSGELSTIPDARYLVTDQPTPSAQEQGGSETGLSSVGPTLLQDLSARNASVQSRLSAVCGDRSESDPIRIVSTALASQHPDGTWGSDDYPIMKACFTAQILEALHHAGMILAPGLPGDPARATVQAPVRRAVEWLRANQHDDGSWGEDTWDTCQVLKALWKSGYRQDDPIMAIGIRYLRNVVEQNWPNRDTYWFGPGFMGAALEVFNTTGDGHYSKLVLDELWTYYDEATGSFVPPMATPDSIRAPIEWHTANTLKGLSSFSSVTPYSQQTASALAWLKQAQSKDGSWGHGHFEITSFCTFEAIMALSLIDGPGSPEAQHGTQWFLCQCAPEAKPNLSALLMATAAIVRTRIRQLVVPVDFVFLYEFLDLLGAYAATTGSLVAQRDELSQDLITVQTVAKLAEQDRTSAMCRVQEVETLIDHLQKDLARERNETAALRNTIQGYALRITGNQLAVIGAALTILTFIIGIIVTLALAKK